MGNLLSIKTAEERLLIAFKKGASERKLKSIINKMNNVNHVYENGKTALFYIGYNHINVFRLLVERGIDLNKQDDKGNVAIVCIKNPHIRKEYLENPSFNVNILNNKKQTILFQIPYFYKGELGLYIDKGIDINHRDVDGRGFLHIIRTYGDISTAYLSGYDVNMQDKYGNTALFYNTHFNNHENFYDLLTMGANINHRNKKGQSIVSKFNGDGYNWFNYMTNKWERKEAVVTYYGFYPITEEERKHMDRVKNYPY